MIVKQRLLLLRHRRGLPVWLVALCLAVPALSLCLASLSGCGGTPLNLYHEFTEQKKSLGNVGIIMDYTMIEGLMEDTSKIDLIQNSRVSNALLTLCADSLSRKGYPIGKTVLSSIGLLMKRDHGYRVVRTPNMQAVDAEELPWGFPPFYVAEEFTQDTTLERLMTLYQSLINLPQKRESVYAVVPEAVSIGRHIDCSTIVVVLAGGFNVPVSKGVGKTTASQSKTMGIVTLQGVSQLSMMMFVIDARTGQIIWDDSKFLSGGVVFPEKIFQLASDLLGRMP